jgi:hypothetical protein
MKAQQRPKVASAMTCLGTDTTFAVPLPLTREAITAEWLTCALGVGQPGVTVTSLRLEDVYHGASGIFRAHVEYDAAGVEANLPPTLMVKGGFEPHSPQLWGVNRSETRFYGDLQPHVTMRSPRCFYAGMDPDGCQSAVILEDLDARGVTWLRYGSKTMGFDATADRMRALAHFHAETWDSPRFAPGAEWEWVEPRYGDWWLGYAEASLEEGPWAEKMASAQGTACSTRLHDRVWMRQALHKLREMDRESPDCLLRGDAHLGNTYVDADGTPGFVDQFPCRSNWSTEVAYSMITSLDLADRPQWEGPLIAVYLEALSSHGVDAPSFDDAYHSYSCSIAYGYWGFVVNATTFQTSAVNTTGSARFAAAAIHNDTIERLS